MGGAWKPKGVLVALACMLALSACGGGSSPSTSQPATTPTTTGSGTGESTGSEAKQGGGSNGGSNGGSTNQGSGSGSGGEGGSSGERSAGFRTPGGDNSIQEFGEEEGAEERAKATKTISTFYAAERGREWAKVCAVLSAKNVEQLELFAKRIPKVKARTCAGVIALLNASAPGGRPPETMKGGVVALRREGDTAFALYHGIDGKDYAFPLKLEGGQWKMTSLGATLLSF
jgi:hypothetical protein